MKERIDGMVNYVVMVKMMFMVGICFGVVLILAPVEVMAKGNLYYVSSTDGNDSNSGTSLEKPLKTIQAGVDKASAGDVVNVRGGTYSEKIVFKKSGSESEGYITLQNYENEVAVISGKTLTDNNSSGKKSSKGKKRSFGDKGFSNQGEANLISIKGVSYIKVKGLEICDYVSDASFDTKGIAISNKDDNQMSNIDIINCKIHNISTKEPNQNQSFPLEVAGNTKNPIKKVLIDGNEIYDCAIGWSEALTINANVDGFTISNNKVHDNGNIGIDVIGHYEMDCEDPKLNQARNGVISGNVVYNCKSPNEDGAAAGIYVDGARDINIDKNYVFNCQHGIEIGCEQKTDFYNKSYQGTAENITVTNNGVFNNEKYGIMVGGFDKNKSGKVNNCNISNNILYNNVTDEKGEGDFIIAWSDNIVIKQNVINANNIGKPIIGNDDVNTATNISIDDNKYYSDKGEKSLKFTWKSKVLTGLKEWKSETKFDLNTKFEKLENIEQTVEKYKQIAQNSKNVNNNQTSDENEDDGIFAKIKSFFEANGVLCLSICLVVLVVINVIFIFRRYKKK